MAAHRRLGLSVGMLHLTPGEKGHRTMAPEEYAAQKRLEAAECAEILGASMWALDYRDGEVPTDEKIKFEVARVIREARPSVIITHWRSGMHKDHLAAHEMLPDARFYAGIEGFDLGAPAHWPARAFYAENWEDLKGFVPEIFVELEPEDLEIYDRAMRSYELFRGGISRFSYLDYYHALCRTRGCEVFSGLAAAFAVPPEQHRRKVQSLMS